MKCHTIYLKHVFAAKGTIYYVAIATVIRMNMQNFSSSIYIFWRFSFQTGLHGQDQQMREERGSSLP